MIHWMNSFTIQYTPINLNRSFPGMLPIRVWNTKTALPMSNWHSLPFWCLSTNAFQRFWSHSKFQILRNCSSSSTRSCFDQIFLTMFHLTVAWLIPEGLAPGTLLALPLLIQSLPRTMLIECLMWHLFYTLTMEFCVLVGPILIDDGLQHFVYRLC